MGPNRRLHSGGRRRQEAPRHVQKLAGREWVYQIERGADERVASRRVAVVIRTQLIGTTRRSKLHCPSRRTGLAKTSPRLVELAGSAPDRSASLVPSVASGRGVLKLLKSSTTNDAA